MNRNFLLQRLRGGLWHTTHPTRFESIMAQGAILPEPDLPESERWCTGSGPRHYPYVRKLGGVSLFDFHGFCPDKYAERYPLSTWYEFVPFMEKWGCAIWVEIDRVRAAPQLISGTELLSRWNKDRAYGHMIMPEIEAAYIGPLHCTFFSAAIAIREGEPSWRPMELNV